MSAVVLSWVDKQSGQTKSIRFDVVSNDTIESLLAITKHPVEEGADVSDHAREDSERITIEGYVSNKPLWSNPEAEKHLDVQTLDLIIPKIEKSLLQTLTPGGLTQAAIGAVDGLLGRNQLPKKYTALAPTGDMPNRAREMYQTLRRAQKEKARVSVSHPLVELTDMIFERIAVPRTTETGNGATFQIDLSHVRIVTTEIVDAPVPTELRGAGTESKGSKAAQKTDDKKKELLKSKIARGIDTGVGIADVVDSALGGI